MFHLYFKIPEKFVRLILSDGFWVVHGPHVHLIKFQFFAQLLVDYIPYSVVSSFILLLLLFAAFADYMIDRFVSITT